MRNEQTCQPSVHQNDEANLRGMFVKNSVNRRKRLTICQRLYAVKLFKRSDKNDIMLMTLEIYLQHDHFIHE